MSFNGYGLGSGDMVRSDAVCFNTDRPTSRGVRLWYCSDFYFGTSISHIDWPSTLSFVVPFYLFCSDSALSNTYIHP
jgi:hypothetical protein